MAVNSMSFQQSATLLTNLMEMMTGESTISVVDESDFVAVGTSVLQQGYDQLNTAVSQLLTKSIYVSRAYNMIYPSIERDNQTWGGVVRKVTILDVDLMDDEAFNLTNGQPGANPFITQRQNAVQFNFYGGNIKELVVTFTEDQLRQAFSSSADFGSFMAAAAQNLINQINQKTEAESRATVNNFIAAVLNQDGDGSGRVIHLITEYKAATGNTTITSSNYLSNAEFEPFAKWVYGRINTLKRFMGERSKYFHKEITTYNGAAIVKPIVRFTRDEDMNIWLLSEFMDQVNASALSGIYNEQLLEIGAFERVNYWQSIDDPSSIKIEANELLADGTCQKTATAVEETGIIGIIFDRDALGITVIDEGVRSIENPRARYFNNFYNWTTRWYNDQTENFVVLILD